LNVDVIIVGAGASGLVAAISAARRGSLVLVIEQRDKAGKKILATGNGKCNYTNLIQLPECYRSEDSAFAMKVLSCFDVHHTIQFFKEIGIYPKERNGYLYPNSEQAASMVLVLLKECERLGVNLIYGEKVVKIEKPNYTVITEKNIAIDENSKTNNKTVTRVTKTYVGRNLILAAGGCASPKLGSDGSGYVMAKSFGHTIIKPLPALVQLKSSDKFCKTLSGVRTTARVTAYGQEKLLACEEGEIIFTDNGISGIPIMQLSRFVAKALDHKEKVYLSIDYLPNIAKDEVSRLIRSRIQNSSGKNIEEMMVGFFNQKLSFIMLKKANLELGKSALTMSPQEIFKLTMQIKEFMITIIDTNSFENAQVCAGGVATCEIDENTLESKLSKNLFVVGELVDVDGTCGGYNLQWAWSSGYLAGIAAASNE